MNHCDRNGFTSLQCAQETNNKCIIEMLIQAVSGSDKHPHSGEKQYKTKPIATASVLPRIIRQTTKQKHGFTGKPVVQSGGGWKPMTVTSETDREGRNHGNNMRDTKQNHGFIGQPGVTSVTDCEDRSSGINMHATKQNHDFIDKSAVHNEGQWKPTPVTLQSYNEGGDNSTPDKRIVSSKDTDVKRHGNAASVQNTTSLILAAESGHCEMVRLLIESGADVNAARSDGYTALMCAAQNGHSECAKLLIDAGANVNVSV